MPRTHKESHNACKTRAVIWPSHLWTATMVPASAKNEEIRTSGSWTAKSTLSQNVPRTRLSGLWLWQRANHVTGWPSSTLPEQALSETHLLCKAQSLQRSRPSCPPDLQSSSPPDPVLQYSQWKPPYFRIASSPSAPRKFLPWPSVTPTTVVSDDRQG